MPYNFWTKIGKLQPLCMAWLESFRNKKCGAILHFEGCFEHEIRIVPKFCIVHVISPKRLSLKAGPSHTGSSWADFNHGLVVHPQGCLGCQKIHKNILQINLLSYCANIHPILKKLQKTSRSHQKWLIFGRTS